MQVCKHCGCSNKLSARFCVKCGKPLQARLVDLQHGQSLHNGRYIVIRELGRGGMGATYLARKIFHRDEKGKPVLESLCVLKVMLAYFNPNDLQDFQAAQIRFEREAQALAELGSHPNIPHLLDWFEEGGQFVLVMEFVDGMDLETKVKQEGTQPLELVIRWGISLCRTLEFLAGKGYIHHDIKPANIILQADSDEPILVDFGTVKAGQWAVRASYGTEGFAPPEQLNPPHQTEPRSDVFALAATLYYLLTADHPSQHPFQFPKLHTIPSPLRGALQSALELNVQRRLTAKEFRERLERCLQPQAVAIAFVSKSGQKVVHHEDWTDYADRNWQEATEHLMRGDVELWLKNIGRFDLSVKAETARSQFVKDPPAALQTFLEHLSSQRAPKPATQIDPQKLNFGSLKLGETATQTLQLTNIGRGYWFGKVETNEGWLNATPTKFGCLPNQSQTVQVSVDSTKLPFRGYHRAQLLLRGNNGVQTVPVQVLLSIAPLLAETFAKFVGAVGGSVGMGVLTFALALVVLGDLPLGKYASFVSGTLLAVLVWFGSSLAHIGTVLGAVIGGLAVWGAHHWLGLEPSWKSVFSVAAASLGWAYGCQWGLRAGAWLGRRIGAVATTALAIGFASITSASVGALWMVVHHAKPLSEVALFVTFVPVTSIAFSAFVGTLAFWVVIKIYRDWLPTKEGIIGIVLMTLASLSAWALWHFTSPLPY